MAVNPRSLAARAIAATLLGIAAYYAIWGGEYNVLDLRRLAHQQEVEARRLGETRRQVDSLRVLIDNLENDPATIEAVARERFGMIRDGEILYRMVQIPLEPSAD